MQKAPQHWATLKKSVFPVQRVAEIGGGGRNVFEKKENWQNENSAVIFSPGRWTGNIFLRVALDIHSMYGVIHKKKIMQAKTIILMSITFCSLDLSKYSSQFNNFKYHFPIYLRYYSELCETMYKALCVDR